MTTKCVIYDLLDLPPYLWCITRCCNNTCLLSVIKFSVDLFGSSCEFLLPYFDDLCVDVSYVLCALLFVMLVFIEHGWKLCCICFIITSGIVVLGPTMWQVAFWCCDVLRCYACVLLVFLGHYSIDWLYNLAHLSLNCHVLSIMMCVRVLYVYYYIYIYMCIYIYMWYVCMYVFDDTDLEHVSSVSWLVCVCVFVSSFDKCCATGSRVQLWLLVTGGARYCSRTCINGRCFWQWGWPVVRFCPEDW